MKRRHTCELFSAVFLATYWYNPLCGHPAVGGEHQDPPVVSGSGGSHQHRPGSFVCGGLLHGRHRRGGSYRYRTADFGSLLLRLHLEADPVRRIPPPGYGRRPGLLSRTVRFGLVSALQQSSLYIGKLLVQGAVELLGHRLHLRLHCRYPHRGVCQLVWRQWRRSNRHFCGAKYWSRTGKTCGKRIFCRHPDDGCPMPVRLYGNVLFCAVSDILFSCAAGRRRSPKGVTYLRIVSCFIYFAF